MSTRQNCPNAFVPVLFAVPFLLKRKCLEGIELKECRNERVYPFFSFLVGSVVLLVSLYTVWSLKAFLSVLGLLVAVSYWLYLEGFSSVFMILSFLPLFAFLFLEMKVEFVEFFYLALGGCVTVSGLVCLFRSCFAVQTGDVRWPVWK